MVSDAAAQAQIKVFSIMILLVRMQPLDGAAEIRFPGNLGSGAASNGHHQTGGANGLVRTEPRTSRDRDGRRVRSRTAAPGAGRARGGGLPPDRGGRRRSSARERQSVG